MENKKHNESQELMAQELEEIAGGIAYQTEEYPSSDLRYAVSETITKKLSDAVSDIYPTPPTYYTSEKYSETKTSETNSPS